MKTKKEELILLFEINSIDNKRKLCVLKEKESNYYTIRIHKSNFKKPFGELIINKDNLIDIFNSDSRIGFIIGRCMSKILIWEKFRKDNIINFSIYRYHDKKVKHCYKNISIPLDKFEEFKKCLIGKEYTEAKMD